MTTGIDVDAVGELITGVHDVVTGTVTGTVEGVVDGLLGGPKPGGSKN